jgi:curved DNA-binding protein CbpA
MSMPLGFYELLGIDPAARPEQVRGAYQTRLGELVRRMRQAKKAGADITVLEAQERTLREAMQVLSDPVRRRRYDAFRQAVASEALEGDEPLDGDKLWAVARDALVDPAAVAAMQVLSRLTTLPVGAPFAKAPPIPARRYGPALADDVMPEFTDPRAPRNPIPGLGIQPPATDQPPVRGEAGLREAERDEPELPDDEDAPPRAVDELERLQTRFGYDGRFLRGVREHRGMTIESVSEATKISVRYLRAIEENAYDSLPASTFVRGYIREFARVLTLPAPDAAVDGFMALFSHHRG